MKRKSLVAVVALGAALTTGLAACGGGTTTNNNGTGNNGNGSGSVAVADAGVGKVYNPSDVKGGTLRIANSGDFDSLDPADTYYGYAWNFVRLYARSLVTFNPKPGAASNEIVPDLAESLGKPSDDGRTWTYTIRKGVKYEDGTEVTTTDIKYNVERSLDKDVFPNGPTYLNDFLDLQGYKGPYKSKGVDLKAIETPDKYTIVFHLSKPFGGFDYFMQLPSTAPVPQAKDTGSDYKKHVLSSGPYMFDGDYQPGKKINLKRNPNWDQATDPIRKALPDRIEVALKVAAEDIDNRLLSGDLDVDIAGTGVQPSTQGKVLGNPDLKKNTDSAAIPRLWYTSINPDVAPLDNIHCRKAVEYATNHTSYQTAYGGSPGGDVATNLLPPQIPGAKKVDSYNFTSKPEGDVDSAKSELQQCGKAGGFTTNISYRAERLKEKATAESLQAALKRVGINLNLKPYPQGDYFKLYAGKPAFAKANGLGLMVNGWGADWTDGFGFLQQIVDSRVIRESGGNTNLTVKIPDVDRLLDQALKTTDTPTREGIWAQIDQRVMDEAVILPGLWAKGLLYRPPNLKNVYVTEAYGMYDYTALSVK
jgi:peptide/nickel transport system substrate-binding protein